MFLPRLAATMLVTILVLGSALAQPAPEAGRCDHTTKRLDRELEHLSEQLVRTMNTQGDPRSVPATRALAELMEMETLRSHLRCLGLRPEDER
jgi:hypothetical protein